MPPDADTTIYSLMLLLSQQNKNNPVNISLEPFNDIKAKSGINLFFGPRESDQVDPAINCSLAILQLKLKKRDHLFDHIRLYLNQLIDNMDNDEQLSYWYTNNCFIYYRLAEIINLDKDYFSKIRVEKLISRLKSEKPKSPLIMAWICSALYMLGCGFESRVLSKDIASNYKADSDNWSYDTFYIQNKPMFNYGSEHITSIYCLEALTRFDH
jgi:hypothetical protein